MGPGPSTVDPRVLRAMSEPAMGYFDEDFLSILSETRELLRYVFQTKNELTLAISGTGTAGMETALSNLIEPGDRVVICVNGFFGNRMVEIAQRYGADVRVVSAPWGEPISPEDVEKELKSLGKVKLVGIVHAETSTGVLQPLKEISEIVHRHGAFLLVDAVTSLGGVEVPTDKFSLDFVYSGTQKCLSCPPGLAPITVGENAAKYIRGRTKKVGNFYLDLSIIEQYWDGGKVYHHTPSMNLIYALNEALRIVAEEGIENRWKRHERNAKALCAGLEAMGLELLVKREYRLPPLTTVKVPEGIDEALVRKRLMVDYKLEIGAGLGELKGKIWRIGLMGSTSTSRNVMLFLSTFGEVLRSLGFKAHVEEGLEAAFEILGEDGVR
ncbi:MAG: alanine--glyoxylate aminotransferase family protein [Synergistetes bacterium]|nr:alanine--glyoxylate aminotransferase family protein [Synergistota bacterium]